MDGMGSLLDITSWKLFLYLQPIHHRPHHPPTPTCQNVRLAKMSAKTRHSHSLVAEVGWYLRHFTKKSLIFGHGSGQITIIPKPEFMGIWGETLPLTITTHLGEFPTLRKHGDIQNTNLKLVKGWSLDFWVLFQKITHQEKYTPEV